MLLSWSFLFTKSLKNNKFLDTAKTKINDKIILSKYLYLKNRIYGLNFNKPKQKIFTTLLVLKFNYYY